MNDAPVLPDDDPVSIPSERTMRGGDSAALGRIDHYDLLRKLGGGGFGVVYLARDTASGVEVALKTLHPLLKHNAEEMDLLRGKFALVSRLAHPNIATALVLHPARDVNVWHAAARRELKLSPGDSVMVMRYAPGVTLSRWRRQFPDGVVPPALALEIGRQIAAALDYAHGERIVHRDVKPGNIMVETVAAEPPLVTRHPSLVASKIRVRILDFGLAAEIRSSMSRVSTEQGDTSGTRPYMAPEQWLGKKQDGRTDQYALACLLYELLSGAPPFAGVFETGDPAIMERAVLGRAPDEIEDTTPAVNAALLRALAKNPKDSFPSCSAFVAALASTTEHTEGTEGRDGSTSRPPDDAGRARSPSAPNGGTSRPGEPQSDAALEADVLRRKVSLARSFAAVSAGDRAEDGLAAFASDAETELSAADEACKFGRFAAAAACLDRAEAALGRLRDARREETENESSPGGLHAAGERFVSTVFGVSVPMRWCPPGAFTMGSPASEDGHENDETQHRVTLTKGFWLGETEVTQGLWKEVMGYNPSNFKSGDDYPVECVSWDDCQDFVTKLNEKTPVRRFRWALPTEAQWEYACRAGTTTAYFWGNALNGDKANCDGNYPCGTTVKGLYKQKTTRVGSYAANPWGFFDMHGNVYEWCADWYGTYPSGAVTNPPGASSGSIRVCRGGAWRSRARGCRSAFRDFNVPGGRYFIVGLRVALVPVQ